MKLGTRSIYALLVLELLRYVKVIIGIILLKGREIHIKLLLFVYRMGNIACPTLRNIKIMAYNYVDNIIIKSLIAILKYN